MLKDKALVRSKIVRAVTAKEASDDLASILPISAGELTVIRSYRFYKTLSAEPKKKTYIEIDKLLPAKKAIEVMTTIENRKPPIVIRPEDLDPVKHYADGSSYDFATGKAEPAAVFIPEWGATVTEVPPSDTRLPADYFFPDKPLVPTKDAVFDGEYSAESLKVLEGMAPASPESRVFVPCRWHGEKYIDQADGDRCTALDPGSKYIDDIYAERLRAVSATIAAATAATNKFNDSLVTANAAAKEFSDAVPRNVDLDEAAPVIHPAPVEAVRAILDDPNPNRDYSYREPTQAFYDKVDELPEPPVTAVETPDTLSIWRPTSHHGQPVAWKYDDSGFKRDPEQAIERPSNGVAITFATLFIIIGLVAAYFHWFKH